MLELGRYSVTEHERIGAIAAQQADIVVSVGIRARAFTAQQPALLKERKALSYDSSEAAAAELPERIKAGDVVLVKGSQSVRMERVVAALLASPGDQPRLVRQELQWMRRP